MNLQLIMLPNPILVSDEKIVCGDMLLNKDNNYCVFRSEYQSRLPEYNNDSQVRKIIAGIEGLPKLDLSDIAEKIGWVDVEKLAESAFKKRFNREPVLMGSAEADSFWLNTWIDGFKAAQSLNEKKFSEEELKDALFYALSIKSETCCTTNTKDSTVRSTIKSLSKPKEYNVEVEMEDIGNKDKVYNCSSKSEWIPKITNNTIKVTKILS